MGLIKEYLEQRTVMNCGLWLMCCERMNRKIWGIVESHIRRACFKYDTGIGSGNQLKRRRLQYYWRLRSPKYMYFFRVLITRVACYVSWCFAVGAIVALCILSNRFFFFFFIKLPLMTVCVEFGENDLDNSKNSG